MRSYRFIFATLLALAGTQSASAGLLVGGPGAPATGDCAGFGCGVELQQIYDASLFSGPVTITSLTFFNLNYLPGTVAPANYTIYLSTTTTAVDGLSYTFLDNVGPDNTLFYGGALGAGAVDGNGRLTLTGNPFDYDPSMGNLLLHLQSDGLGEDDSIYLDFAIGLPNNTMSRAYALTSFGSADAVENNVGLVTQFGFATDTPEPGSAWLMAAGGAMLAGLARARAKR